MITENRAPDLESTVAGLKEQQAVIERQIAEGRDAIEQARAAVTHSEDDLILGKATDADCAAARDALAAQERLASELKDQLARHMTIVGRAERMRAEQQARQAEEAVEALQAEIVVELQSFAVEMTKYSERCARIRTLRRRAAELSGQLFSPAVMLALGSAWGEIIPAAVEGRLDLIAECAHLADEPNAIVRTAARRRSLAEKADAEFARQCEAQRNIGGKLKIDESFEMKLEGGQVVFRRLQTA